MDKILSDRCRFKFYLDKHEGQQDRSKHIFNFRESEKGLKKTLGGIILLSYPNEAEKIK
jgi:hypothetical protein